MSREGVLGHLRHCKGMSGLRGRLDDLQSAVERPSSEPGAEPLNVGGSQPLSGSRFQPLSPSSWRPAYAPPRSASILPITANDEELRLLRAENFALQQERDVYHQVAREAVTIAGNHLEHLEAAQQSPTPSIWPLLALAGGVGLVVWLMVSRSEGEGNYRSMGEVQEPLSSGGNRLEDILWTAAKSFVGSASRKLGSKLSF